LGYAQFPFSFFGTPPRTSTDGIAMAFGAVGNAAGTNKFVTAHEVGHWLGLFHTWGDADCGDDQVDDTPIQRGQNFGWWCGDPLTVKQATCYENFLTSKQDSIMRFIIGENYQNYMDYGDCKVMFTRGQLDRMNFTLTNIPFRANLITEANILKTGTNDDFTCERLPIPEFWTQNNMVCVGDNVTLTNGTFNGIADSYLWEMPGASPSTSTDVNPTVTYAQSGVYSVTLKAIKNGQEFSKVRTELVYVMPQQAESKFWGYLEGFEDGNLLNLGGPWMNINLDKNSNRWEITADAAFTGVASLRMKNENSTRGEIDRLITPPFDISAIPNSGAAKVLEFKYAYARKTNQEGVFNPASGSFEEVLNDELKVFFSTNCGKTWLERTTLTGNALVTAGLVAGGFVPQSKDQWRTLELTIPATFANATNLQVMFEWKAGSAFGNDFYLDDFRIWDKNSTGIAEDIDNAIGLNIYPNPSNDFVKVNFTLPESISKADIILTDMAGRLVSGIYSGALNQGEHTYTIERSQVRNSGLYFLKINLGGREIVKKVMFN
jgi:PKD repeat protein